MTPSETILEQQRRLLASIESIDGLLHAGRLTECRGAIADFESDLGSAMEAPILRHLKSRLALVHERVRSLEATASKAGEAPVRKVDVDCDPLLRLRGRLGEGVPASDLNAPVPVPDTTQIWWRCSRDPQHRPWKATGAQMARGRPCPSCMGEAGLTPDAWRPTDTSETHLSVTRTVPLGKPSFR
jgi:hypothetical protein